MRHPDDDGRDRGIDRSFWQGRRVFVTGCTGFKGSWLCAWLVELGAEVTGYALHPRFMPSLFDGLGLRRSINWAAGDIRDRARLTAALGAAKPEIILHLAAQPIVFTALDQPVETIETNVIGTLNLLEAVRRRGETRTIVCVTSDKCYREPHGTCREEDALGGDEPYGASKACAEILIAAWRTSYLRPADGIGLASARAGNVIGGGDFSSHRLIPDMVRAAAAGRAAILRHPQATRPWQHVLDALHGYLLLAQALHRAPADHAAAWNFGPPDDGAWTVARIAAAVQESLGGQPWQLDPSPRKAEAPIQRLAADRAADRLGWRPRLDTARAITWTIEGYRAFLENGMTDWVQDQIGRFAQPTFALPDRRRPVSLERNRETSRRVHSTL